MRPAQRHPLAQDAVLAMRTTIEHACRTFGIIVTCYRHQERCVEEDAGVADWFERLTTTFRTWGFGQCFRSLQNVKQLAWN